MPNGHGRMRIDKKFLNKKQLELKILVAFLFARAFEIFDFISRKKTMFYSIRFSILNLYDLKSDSYGH